MVASPASRQSAGIALVRIGPRGVHELLLVHPGGPFWAGKDEHAWSIPKGEFDPDNEDAEEAARREFAEELGQPVPTGPAMALTPFRSGPKTITAFLVDGDLDTDSLDLGNLASNRFEMEWPPRSGRRQSFPEVDDAQWFPLEHAGRHLHKNQAPLVDLVSDALRHSE